MDDHDDGGSNLNYAAVMYMDQSYEGCFGGCLMGIIRLIGIVVVVKAIFMISWLLYRSLS
jgi:hypothetical protein